MHPRIRYAIAGIAGAILAGGIFLWLDGRVVAETLPTESTLSETSHTEPARPHTPHTDTAAASTTAEHDHDSSRPVADRSHRGEDLRLVVPAETSFSVTLTNAVDSGERRSGDRFEATLDNELRGDGRVVARPGGAVSGRVVGIETAGRVKGREAMTLAIDRIETVEGVQDIRTHDLTMVADGTQNKDAAVIGGSAAAGAVVGAILGGGKGATKGAVIGGVAGTVTVLATKGGHIHLESGQQLTFQLDRELAIETKAN